MVSVTLPVHIHNGYQWLLAAGRLMLGDVGTGEQQQVAQLRASRYVWTKLSWDLGKATGMDQVSRVSGFRPWQHLTQPKRFCLTEDTSACGGCLT